jgi:UMP-CMP kinase
LGIDDSLISPPGSGKGTQCKLLTEKLNMLHLSAGQLLRNELTAANSKVAKLIEKNMKEGTIVPVDITCGLLYQEMQKQRDKVLFL